MRIAWVLGWAVPADWFEGLVRRAMPASEHCLFAPVPDALERIERGGPFDLVVGYSLGSQLLLGDSARVSRLGRIALLAPIFAFPAEDSLGGRVSRTQVRHLSRWLKRDSEGALRDFYDRAGLAVPRSAAVDTEGLQWGLEQLGSRRIAPPLPPHWRAWCGENDALLDAAKLRQLEPRIEVIRGATHNPEALIAGLAEELG